VGVGASEGGLKDFEALLSLLPPDTGLAFVLVQHLDPGRASRLAAVLSRSTTMEVVEASNGLRVEPNHVYVISPGALLAVEHGLLKLIPVEPGAPRSHQPIDFLFRSLAADRGRKTVGVLLSGKGADGLEGLLAIREGGGITLAQNPRSARFGEVARGAVEAGAVDACLGIPALGAELVRLAGHPYLAQGEPIPTSSNSAAFMAEVASRLRSETDVDFTEYQQEPLLRRIGRRMALREAWSMPSYLEALAAEPAEVKALFGELIGTNSSRAMESADLEEVRSIAIPEILARKATDLTLRAWVIGCATGEEVYALAMALIEQVEARHVSHPVLVFGSDLDARALLQAGEGACSDADARALGPERLKRFFVRSGRGWAVSPALRERCVFVRHDVAHTPPFSRLDLVCCKNVLGAFGKPLQRRVLATIHQSLNQPGYLLLDRAEATSGAGHWFKATHAGGGLFLRRAGPSSFRFDPAPGNRLPAGRRLLTSPHEDHARKLGALSTLNDDLVSGNDALEGLNEELETVQEELKSSNEDLGTLNDQLQDRNRELRRVSADVLNLLDAVEIPILMLDAHRCLRRFTSRAASFLGLAAADVGRPITDLALPLQLPDLEVWITSAMESGELVEAEVQDSADRWHRIQVRARRRPDGTVDGAILSLVDIDKLRTDVEAAGWARDYARSMVEAVPVPLVVLDLRHQVITSNAAYRALFGEESAGSEGRGFFELDAGAWEIPALRQAVSELGSLGRFQALELERNVAVAGRRTYAISGCAIAPPNGRPMVLLTIEDVTARRRAERQLDAQLTTILLHAQALQQGHLGEGEAVALGAGIEAEARHQARLVQALVDLNGAAAGKVESS
jgi:PAS domain S-box-containing protein